MLTVKAISGLAKTLY